jgi:hypothetical protein
VKRVLLSEFYKHNHSGLFLGLTVALVSLSTILYSVSYGIMEGSIGFYSFAMTSLVWFIQLYFPVALIVIFAWMFTQEAGKKVFRNNIVCGVDRTKILDGKILFGVIVSGAFMAMVILIPLLLDISIGAIYIEESTIPNSELILRTGGAYFYSFLYLVSYALFCTMVSLLLNNHKIAISLTLSIHFFVIYISQFPVIGDVIRRFTFWTGPGWLEAFWVKDIPSLDLTRNIVVFAVNIILFYLVSLRIMNNKDF